MTPAPYRILTDRLCIRCWDPADAQLLKVAIDSSLEHLRPWIPWAHDDPQPIEEKIALLRRFRAAFDQDEDYLYAILDRGESEVIGGTGLHRRVGDDAFEIGYWIRSNRVRRGFVTEATAALTRAAFEVCGADRVEIRIDPANVASLAVPRKLGYREEATLRRRIPTRVGRQLRDSVVFTLFTDELAGSSAMSTPYEAFDARGEPIAPTAG